MLQGMYWCLPLFILHADRTRTRFADLPSSLSWSEVVALLV
ncbi:hypothetical protein [Deinococcus sonorensis]|uniref:Transposase n=2 Tax=Deinococcus sonorensis TaxID=309891 RepID=A0AAU7U643_9DEIO